MSMQSKLLPGEARSWLEKVSKVREEKKKNEVWYNREIRRNRKEGAGAEAAGLQLNEEDTTHPIAPGISSFSE